MQTTTSTDRTAAQPVAALRDRLDKLTTSHQRMQRVNSCVRNRNVRGLKEMGYTDDGIAKLLSGAKRGAKPYQGGGFFPSYKIDHAALQIRTVRAEIEAAELASGDVPHQVEGDAYSYRHDALSVTFSFTAKPDKGTRAILRRFGFMRASGEFQYSREWSSAALRAAASVRRALDV